MAEIAPIAVAAVDKLGVSCSGSLEESSFAIQVVVGDIPQQKHGTGIFACIIQMYPNIK